MNVRELIEMLEDFDGDTEVLIAHQPGYPLALQVANVVDEGEHVCDEDCNRDCEGVPNSDPAVWIVAGDHPWDRSPYAPSAVFAGSS